MAYEEGFRRLRFIVRGVLMSGLCLIITGAAIKLLSMFLTDFTSEGGPISSICIVLGLYLAMLGGVLWVVLWVIAGFAGGPNSPQQ
jgi:hypothetical protein